MSHDVNAIQIHTLDDAGPGLRLSVGVSRSGKTFGLRRQVYRAVRAGVPVVVLDRMREWTSLPPDVAQVAVGATPDAGVRMAAEWLRTGARLAIVQTNNVEADAQLAAEWAVADRDEHRGLAISEVHRVAPNTGARLPEYLENVALAWAHHNVSFWCDTQRLARLHRDFTEQGREARVYATGGQLDLARLKEWGGQELSTAALEAARRFLAGEPGWHVKIRTVALPPYELEREPL